MKLLIKYPTRQRPELFKRMLDEYLGKLSGRHEVRVLVSADIDDEGMASDEMKDYIAARTSVELCLGRSTSKIEAINADLAGRIFDILILASDDMMPEVSGYDDVVARAMMQYFPNLDGCLHFNDGRRGRELNTLPIMGFRLFSQFGYIYHPDYKSFFADDEFMAVTRASGREVYLDRIIISHQWMDIVGGKMDSLYRRNSTFWKEDQATFGRRRSTGFPKYIA